MPSRFRNLGFVLLTLSVISVSGSAQTAEQQTVENLTTFARLYGYVRWFHPSDEASAADWWQVAVDGVSDVRVAGDQQQLVDVLNDHFQPLTRGLVLESLVSKTAGTARQPYDAGHLVAWQHRGAEFDPAYTTYQSVRTGIGGEVPLPPSQSWRIARVINAFDHRGASVRVRMAARCFAANDDSRAFVAISSHDPESAIGFHQELEVDTDDNGRWESYELIDDHRRTRIGDFLCRSQQGANGGHPRKDRQAGSR